MLFNNCDFKWKKMNKWIIKSYTQNALFVSSFFLTKRTRIRKVSQFETYIQKCFQRLYRIQKGWKMFYINSLHIILNLYQNIPIPQTIKIYFISFIASFEHCLKFLVSKNLLLLKFFASVKNLNDKNLFFKWTKTL